MTTKEELKTKFRKIDKIYDEITNLRNEYSDLIDEIRGEVITQDDTKQYGLWKPKEGEEYWTIKPANATVDYYLWRDDNGVDLFNYTIGNCFKTKEQAEKALERLKIRRQLRDIAQRLNKGRVIDWDSKISKYFIFIWDGVIRQGAEVNRSKQQGTIYCLDENFKDTAIAEIGEDRLTEYLKEC